ncbi:MAG TPA: preprotein translocase subunit SecB [Methylobacter sp.]|jgi:hypothetical protein
MLTENLQKAIDTLRIHDVYLRNSISQCFNGFDPKYTQDLDKLETQTKHAVKQSQVAQLDDSKWLMRVFIELGVRLVDPLSESEDDSVKAMVEAEFVAEYITDEEPGEECINEYALKNASFHVWPYWREYLMSQCGRMHLPRLVLPTVQFAKNRHESVPPVID